MSQSWNLGDVSDSAPSWNLSDVVDGVRTLEATYNLLAFRGDFSSTCQALEKKESHACYDKVLQTFQDFDINGDGTIDRGELFATMQVLDPVWSEKRVDDLLHAIDRSGDSKIQVEELLRWVFGGGALDEPFFSNRFDLNNPAVQGAISVEVKDLEGGTVYGPEEMLGTMTVASLRRRMKVNSGISTGCLCKVGVDSAQMSTSDILRDSFFLGAYCEDEDNLTLTVIMIKDAFTFLTEKCREELEEFEVFDQFQEVPCIRIGKSKDLPIGDEGYEFMLTSDGRLLAKHYECEGFCDTDDSIRQWRYQIAEGSFTILEGSVFHVELNWRRWSERLARDRGKSDDAASWDDWEAKEITDDTGQQTKEVSDLLHNEVPNSNGDFCSILQVARTWLQDKKPDYVDDQDDPLAGFPMPGASEAVLCDLEMDVANVEYWCHGVKRAGPCEQEQRIRRRSEVMI